MTNKENLFYENKNVTLRGYSENDHIFKQIKQSNSFYELKLLNKVKSLNLNGTYVDVGANIGNHTLFFSQICNSKKVISIEMDKKIFDVLDTNVTENNSNEKVTLYNIGIGEKEKKVRTSSPDLNNIGMTKIIDENGDVLVKTLDNLLQNETDVSLIKIDVEGYELNVLNGAKNLINKNLPVIISELKTESEFIGFEKVMNSLGYYTDKINYASTPTYFWFKKKFDYIYLIPSYNRFEKVKNLIDKIISLNQNSIIILINDGSVDIRYENFQTYNKKLVYLKNNQNLGKNNFWVTINNLFKKLSTFDFKKCIMLGDDFDLIQNFDTLIEKISNDKDIIRLFTQKNTKKNWGYDNWVDGALCAPKKFFDDLNYILHPIDGNSKMISSGVGYQMTQRINKLKYKVLDFGSLLIHNGNELSVMHPEIRKKQPLIGVPFRYDPSLSVIIPTFNNTNYIDECINSILESSKNSTVELLIGIDGCEKTLNHVKNKTYPDFVKFYYFNSNNGPYDIKNSLVQKSNSDNLLFFDSDDIMTSTTIDEVINNFKNYNIIRLKYNEIKDGKTFDKPNFGEGVFAIKKSLFLSMNGFEPWKVAADSDFMGRIYKKRPKIYHTKNIAFYRRLHSQSLTKRSDTGMSSQLRASYVKISKNKKGDGNPDKLHTRDFVIVDVNTIVVDKKNNEYYNHRKSQLDKVLNSVPRKVVDKQITKKDPVTSDRLETLFQNKPELVRTIKTNKPQDRQELINKKNNTNNTIKELFPSKPNRREGKNFINFGGKFKG